MTERLTFASTVTAEGRRLKGEVILAGQQTRRNGELVEVEPAAFMRADATDSLVVIGHQASVGFETLGYDPLRTVARASNGSLRLTRTERGFTYETDELPNTAAANDTLALASAGLLGGTSFEIVGVRSKFSSTPEGTRVRTYNSIEAITAITPVLNPAFPSTVAAFSKESTVTEAVVEEPKVPATPPPPAPPATFTEQPKSGEDWSVFAKDLSPEQLEGAMDAIFSRAKGDPKGNELDQYQAFSTELRNRKRITAETKQRIENLQFAHMLAMGRVPKAPEAELFASDDYKQAFNRWLRTGDKNVMEQFTGQSIAGDGTQGGYTVPTDFRNKVVETQKAYGGVQQVAEVIETSDGRDLPWPTNDDTGNSAAIATEGSAVGSGGADLVFGQVSLGAYSYSATGASNSPLAVSKELIEDSAFDIESFVARKLGERLGRKMAADYATGDGSGKPYGLFSKSADVMSATTLYAALVEHFFQVDQAYRDNASWVLGDTVLTKAYASLDDNGRPLFQRNQDATGASGIEGFLLGKPVVLDQGSAANVAFGDIRAGLVIRRIKSIRLDIDPYTLIAKRQIAFHAWARTDSAIQDSAAYSVSDYTSVSADS